MAVLLGGACPSQVLRWEHLCFRNGGGGLSSSSSSLPSSSSVPHSRRRASARTAAFWPPSQPVVEMEPISDDEHLDRILHPCLQGEEPSPSVVIDWMAAWCRKCIYLKPKLEKLAVEFHPKVKFYSIDVNKVPLSLVKRGNISKMPTIQLWKDGEMKAEIIGGHKAWLVVEEVREMIQKNI